VLVSAANEANDDRRYGEAAGGEPGEDRLNHLHAIRIVVCRQRNIPLQGVAGQVCSRLSR
jgi:hypothetical protein